MPFNNNTGPRYKKGDPVHLHSCLESDYFEGIVLRCREDSRKTDYGSEIVWIRGLDKYPFNVKYLKSAIMNEKIDPKTPLNKIIREHGTIAHEDGKYYAVLDFLVVNDNGEYYITNEVPESILKIINNPLVKKLIS